MNEFEVRHGSRPPLRWIANLSGRMAHYLLQKYLETDELPGRVPRHRTLYVSTLLMIPSYKWGTSYIMKMNDDE